MRIEKEDIITLGKENKQYLVIEKTTFEDNEYALLCDMQNMLSLLIVSEEKDGDNYYYKVVTNSYLVNILHNKFKKITSEELLKKHNIIITDN